MTDLSALSPFLALAIYPAAFLLGFSFNPIEFRWTANLARSRRPSNEPMPQALQDRADAITRYLNFLVDAFILGLIALLTYWVSLDAARLGLRPNNWKDDGVIGVTAGALLIAAEWLMVKLVPIDPKHPFTSRVRKGSLLLWVFTFITGAFSEELWIALCLVILTATGHSAAVSVVMTVIVFAAVHYGYGLGGAIAVAVKGAVSAMLFLHYGSVIVTFFFHFIGNLGSLYWNRYWRC